MGAFKAWQQRRAAREAKRAGDKWICPYCRAVHPEYELGGTTRAFGYPSVKFACCGKVAFMYNDPHQGHLLGFVRVGDGITEWLPKEQYFAWVEEQKKARGKREDSPHQFAIGQPPRAKREVKPKTSMDDAPAPVKPAPAAKVGAGAAAGSAPAPSPPAMKVPWQGFVTVAKVDEVPQGKGMVVDVQGLKVALFNVEGTIHALQNACPHKANPLGEGMCEDGVVACPGHGWMFDVRTGRNINNPESHVPRFEVKVADGAVLLGGPMAPSA